MRIEQKKLAVARTLAEEAMSLAIERKRAVQIGYAYRVLGRVDRLEGRLSDAEDHLQKSLELVDSLPYERALTLLELGQLASVQPGEDNTHCLDYWEEALALFDSLGAVLDADVTKKSIWAIRKDS